MMEMTGDPQGQQQLLNAYTETVQALDNGRTDDDAKIMSKNGKTVLRKYKFMKLSTAINHVKTAAKDKGFTFVQPISHEYNPGGGNNMQIAAIDTYIIGFGATMHIGHAPFPVQGSPTAMGSYITYLRRYSLYSAFSFMPDKDFGGVDFDQEERERAEYLEQQRQAQQQANVNTYGNPNGQPPRQNGNQNSGRRPQNNGNVSQTVDKNQVQTLSVLASQLGMDATAFMAQVFAATGFKYSQPEQIPTGQYETVRAFMQNLINERNGNTAAKSGNGSRSRRPSNNRK